MLGTRYEFLIMRKVISGQKRHRNTNNLEKSDFLAAICLTFFLILTLFYSIWAMLATRYEFLTMRKVISDQKRYRNTNNLEKVIFSWQLFFDIFLDFDPILLNLSHVRNKIPISNYAESDQRSETV